MFTNYFSIINEKEVALPFDNKILGLLPEEILKKEVMKIKDNISFIAENDINKVFDNLIGKKGNITFINNNAVCITQESFEKIIKSCSNKDKKFAIARNDNGEIALLTFEIELLLDILSFNPINVNSMTEFANILIDGEVPFEDVDIDDECIILRGSENYDVILNQLYTANNSYFKKKGIYILDPTRTYIDFEVEIGKNTVVYPGNIINAGTKIGSDCILLPNNRIEKAVIGDKTKIESSVLLNCNIGNNTTVGPYAYIRPNSNIGDNCRIGDFVEIKNSNIDNGTKVSHLTYVGDSDLGKSINLGCGVVFVNYDGKIKQRSIIDDNAFIGCNTNIVSPVHVGKNAYIAAGATVTEPVPDNALYIARSRGIVKENWVIERKEKGKL